MHVMLVTQLSVCACRTSGMADGLCSASPMLSPQQGDGNHCCGSVRALRLLLTAEGKDMLAS